MQEKLEFKRQESKDIKTLPQGKVDLDSLDSYPISQGTVVMAWELLAKDNLWKLLHKKEQFLAKK